MRKLFILMLLLCLCKAGVGQSVSDILAELPPVTQADRLQYWYDDDIGTLRSTQQLNGMHTFDVSALLDGMHTLHVQIIDNTDAICSPCSHAFLKLTKQSSIPSAKQLQYWFDDSETITTAPLFSGVQLLDVNSLLDGLHTVHYQVVDENGRVSTPCSQVFLKLTSQASTSPAKQLQYWFDDSEKITTAPLSSGVQLLDVNSLLDGLHTLHFQVVDEFGRVSTPCSQVFLKLTDVHATGQPTHIRYWFDDDDTTLRESTTVSGLQILDVSELVTGLHTVHVMLADENGRTTVPYTAIFLKLFTNNTPNGKDAITSYKYWVNDNIENIFKAEIADPDSTYGLVTLLPIPMTPIRSSSFLFRVEEETPVLYAQNDFHIRFYNAMGYYCDCVQSFADYRVREEVTDITPLESGVRMYMEKPGENEIRWFRIDVERGDSLTFKLGQAATLQVLAADGTEVYAAQGAASVKTDGCRVHADGRYYVAVHDVTAQTATNIALDYRRINKYAVISHTPKKLGLTDCEMVMTLYGNGFDKLTAACLRSNTQTLNAHTIVANGYADAVLQFSVHKDSLTMGNYDLQLTFTDGEKGSETLTVANAVALETAKYGKVQLRFEDKRVFTRPHPVKLHIKNTGNVPYQMVPVTIAHDNIEKIEKLTFENFGDVLPKEQADAGARVDFLTENLFNTGKAGRIVPFFIPSLEPGEEIELDVSILAPAHTHLNFYTWTGMPWSLYGSGEENYSDPILEETPEIDPSPCDYMKCFDEYKDMPCDSIMIKLMEAVKLYSTYKNPVTADSLALLGYKSPQEVYDSLLANSWFISGQGSSVKNKNTRIIYLNRVVYSSSDDEKEIDGGGGTGGSGGGTGGSGGGTGGGDSGGGGGTCGGPVYFYFFPPVLTTFYICPGWVVETLTPGDPNDLIGYTHESGSHAMNAAMAENGVPYTIRFENDPEIATAAAHTIVVTNQLDKEMFDFSTYAPNSIKIGNVVTDLDGTPNFVKTIDMRPRLNVIAQVTSKFDAVTGKAEWKIESLDPMTMEPTQYAMDGVLPINTDGNGAGEICYTVKLRDNLPNGTTFENKASIVFDYEDAMETPVWSNMLDFEPPHSVLKEIGADEDRNVSFNIEGTDEGAGIWQYRIYAQEGYQGEWKHVASISADSLFAYPCKPDTDYGFCVLAVDSAGNVEQKPLAREGSFADVDMGDVNGDGEVNTLDASLTTAYYLGKQAYIIATAADVNGDGVIDTLDATQITQMFLDAQGIAPETNALPRRRVKPKQTLQP